MLWTWGTTQERCPQAHSRNNTGGKITINDLVTQDTLHFADSFANAKLTGTVQDSPNATPGTETVHFTDTGQTTDGDAAWSRWRHVRNRLDGALSVRSPAKKGKTDKTTNHCFTIQEARCYDKRASEH
jgi:hypothetical protein